MTEHNKYGCDNRQNSEHSSSRSSGREQNSEHNSDCGQASRNEAVDAHTQHSPTSINQGGQASRNESPGTSPAPLNAPSSEEIDTPLTPLTPLDTPQNEEYDTLFDEELRATAHALRAQLSPSGEVLKATLAVAQQEPSGRDNAQQPPQSAKLVPLKTARRRRNRTAGILAAAAAVVLVVVGGVAAANLAPGLFAPASYVQTNAEQPALDARAGAAESAATTQAIATDTTTTPTAYDELYELIAGLANSYAGGAQMELLDSSEAVPSAPLADSSTNSSEAPSAGAPAPTSPGNAGSAAADATAGKTQAETAAASNYSQTNTQVEGIDEADIVKTDGTYIYSLVSGERILIAQAAGADTHLVGQIDLKQRAGGLFYASDFYIVKGRLVVPGTVYDGNIDAPATNSYGIGTQTHSAVFIYDVSTPKKPKLLMRLGQSGQLGETRLSGNTLTMLSTYYVYSGSCNSAYPESYIPSIYAELGEMQAGEPVATKPTTLACGDVRVLPNPSSAVYTVVTVINVERAERAGELAVLGNASTVYMSANNLYLAAVDTPPYRSNMPEVIYDEAQITQGYEFSLWPWDLGRWVRAKIREWLGVTQGTQVGSAGSAGRSTSGGSASSSAANPSVAAPPPPVYLTYTRIVRLDLTAGKPQFAAETKVEGTLHNQFSLDEYEGNLRVALTTTREVPGTTPKTNSSSASPWQTTESVNRLVILSSGLKQLGSVENLAPGERIYSVRFTGEVGYVVTFKQVDPLFSLDLKDPRNPRVMDALKIPGFSEYLHPFAEGLLLGIGRDAFNSGGLTGDLKLSMFDTSNPFDLSELEAYRIPATGSPALSNHKSVIINAEHNIIGFAIEAHEGYSRGYAPKSEYLVCAYDEQYGFLTRLLVELPADDRYGTVEARGLFIDNYFYLVAGDEIGVYDLDSLEELSWVTLAR